MISSQEKISKYIYTIEKNIEKTVQNESKESVLNDYVNFLLGEINVQKEDEISLKLNQGKQGNIKCHSFANSSLALAEKVQTYEKRWEELEDEMDTLIIQSIAERQSLKIQEEEKRRQMLSFYKTENNTTIQQLEQTKMECFRIVQDIQNQVTLEIATKNARIYELKSNLKRQIMERNGEIVKVQTENKELRKKLDILKADLGRKEQQKRNYRSDFMQFETGYVVQEYQNSLTDISNAKNNVYNNIVNMDYTNTEPGIKLAEKKTQNKLESTIHFGSNNKESTRKKELLMEYNEIENKDEKCDVMMSFTQPVTSTDNKNPSISRLKRNPFCLASNSDITLRTKPVVASKGNKLGPLEFKNSPPQEEEYDITINNSIFLEAIKQNDSFQDKSDVPRKLPVVYLGKSKRIKTYK